MKPHKTLLFILAVFVLLFDISLIYPEDGIKLGKNFTLNFVTFGELFSQDSVVYADITEIISENELLNDSVIEMLAEGTDEPITDTIIGFDTIRADASKLKASIQRIEFPTGNKKVLHPFFKELNKLSTSGKLIRVMHYGDSQIEGDRITSYIRRKLQTRFGGSGVGLVPVLQPYKHSFSIEQENSENWMRKTVYGNRDTTLLHKRYGVLGSFCRFSPIKDSIVESDATFIEAWANYQATTYGYSNTKSFEQVRIFYSHNRTPFMLQVEAGNGYVDADMYESSSSLQTITFNFNEPVSSVNFTFSGYDSPDFYALAFDGLKGVAVDNIAMRGSAGTIFTKMDFAQLIQMYKELNTKLIILEFGGNVVPYIKGNYKQYGRWFKNQLELLKKAAPNVPILVIGVADMSEKDGTMYKTYDYLEKVRDVMKQATFEAGCAYWDMYEAMGGYNSMPSWVFAEPPLASTDFVHFTSKGALIVAQMFYNALMFEYNTYNK